MSRAAVAAKKQDRDRRRKIAANEHFFEQGIRVAPTRPRGEIEIAETEMMTDERAGLVAAEARDFTSDELYIVREGNEIESLISALEARGFAFKEAQG